VGPGIPPGPTADECKRVKEPKRQDCWFRRGRGMLKTAAAAWGGASPPPGEANDLVGIRGKCSRVVLVRRGLPIAPLRVLHRKEPAALDRDSHG